MEKFIKIAESIADLEVFNAYEIVRLDIQLDNNKNRFCAYLTLHGTEGNSVIDFIIKPDGTFYEL